MPMIIIGEQKGKRLKINTNTWIEYSYFLQFFTLRASNANIRIKKKNYSVCVQRDTLQSGNAKVEINIIWIFSKRQTIAEMLL